MIDPMTGEIIQESDIDSLLGYIETSEKTIAMLRVSVWKAKEAIYQRAEFGEGKTARVQGDKYKCKVEMPSKIMWDQAKLAKVYKVGFEVVDIASYKVNMREYKKMINTVGNESYNKCKEELISANLGVSGTPRFTIE